ncbi:MAG: transglycosylase domain-containing protein [Anaerolineae bacterium]|nr:transglycosylase domain-containing protein [Anaerolineae bacterium]
MADRPTNATNSQADEPENGGWHTPQTPASSGWREAQPAPKPAEEEHGWRAPQKAAAATVQESMWRTVSPGETALAETPDDGEILPHDESPAPEAQPEISPSDALAQINQPYSDSPLALAQQESTPTDVTAAESDESSDVLPFEQEMVAETRDKDDSFADQLAELAKQAEQEQTLDLLDEDEDEDSFSMSELVALASLVDEQPRARLQPQAEAGAKTGDEAASASPDDPAEVARRKVAELMGAAAEPGEGDFAAEDPAEVARRMAQKLAASQSSPAVGLPTPSLTREEQVLLDKFRSAEDEIRGLRARFRAGQLTREQMQAELRKHMVLDEDQVWWMMGVESDTWYRYDNGQWVPSTPDILQRAGESFDADENGVTSPMAARSGDLPHLADQLPPGVADEGATMVSSAVQSDYDNMPLPRQVPIRDPEATIPGTPGVYMDPSGMAQPTVASAAVNPADVVAAPQPATTADAPPSYDIGTASPLYEQARSRQQQSLMRTLLIVGGIGIAALFLLSACGIIGGVLYYRSLAAPWEDEVAALANYQPQFRTARILAADGSVIAELTSQQGGARDTIPLGDISPYMIHAVISTENARFYDDPGWDPLAIARAFFQNILAGQVESGATTLTQEIAQNLILRDNSVSAQRKLDEIVIASMIAQRYDKNFILQLYLNEFFYGNQSYGVEAASQFYFGHSAADLNLPESALLAGLLQAPATYDPVVNRQASFDRMDTVLDLMARAGCLRFQHAPYEGQEFCITRGVDNGPSDIAPGGLVTVQKAQIESAQYRPREFRVRYPHFVNYVQQFIEETYGTDALYRGGYEIRTTLVPRVQDVAQDALLRQTQSLIANNVNAGSVLVTDPRSGAILAMVGSPDFNNVQFQGQNNFAFLPQQPGSSIKPVTYAAALEGFTGADGQRQYMTPATIIWDVPTTYNTTPPYSPVNFDGTFHGPQPVRYALQNSYNVPAVKTYAFVGADRFRDMAQRLGLRFGENAAFGLPTALGADEVLLYDMVQAYGTFANDGLHVPLFAVTQITDFQGNQVVIPESADTETQAISPSLAYLMQNILSDNQARSAAFGLNSGLALSGYPDGVIGAKTGTSNDNRDLWTMGFTNNTVVGVWMGNLDNNPTRGTTQTASVPVWNAVMRAALEGRSPEAFANPGGVVQGQICGDTGTLFDPNVNPNCTSLRAELFLENQQPPPATSSFVQSIAVDTWTGLRATTACPEYVETRTFANIDDPFAIQWLNSPAGQGVAQQLGLPIPLESLPQGECPPNQQPNIRITSPADGQQLSGIVPITGIVSAANFNRFQIELAPVNQPDNFAIIAGPFTSQVTANGTIVDWNTTTVPNGIYRLRLAAFANNGGYVFKVVQVGINNALPTAIIPPTAILPTAQATVIPPGAIGQTAPLFPTAQATLAPGFATATPAGFIPLGQLMPLATATPFGQ